MGQRVAGKQRHSWASVDKASSVLLPLEPLTRPLRSRKLHVGTWMNPAHVTSAGEGEWDLRRHRCYLRTHIRVHTHGSAHVSSLVLIQTARTENNCALATVYTWTLAMLTFKGTNLCICVCELMSMHMYSMCGCFRPLFPMNCINPYAD